MQKPIRETIPFTIASEQNIAKQTKPCWDNSNQEEKNEKFKTLKKLTTTLMERPPLLIELLGIGV